MVRVTLEVQPFEFVKVIVVEPTLSPVTRPELDTLAILELLEIQALFAAAVPLPVNCMVELRQTILGPLIIGLG